MAPDTSSAEPAGRPGALRRANRPPAQALRLSDLEVPQRRRALVRCGVTIALAWILILGAFYVLPIGRESDLRAFTRLGTDIAIVAAVFVWQIKRIGRAELPELRAVEALGIVIAVFLVAFSSIYLAMSNQSVTTFTQVLDQTRALYFTVSVFSTVGFGDITPRTDPARLVVAAQMLLDFVVIGVVVRMLFNAARSRVAPTGDAGGAGATGTGTGIGTGTE
jgi:voltage-gated potassium channel